ncbi:MAG: hypothetical protein ACI9KE_000710 [Polyangiales bacterium]|jgi:hypothetical protein
MSRFFALSLALLTLSAAGASAQPDAAAPPTRRSDAGNDEAAVVPTDPNPPSTFQYSLSAGFGSSFSSLHEDLVRINGDAYDDVPDAFGVTGSLTLGAVAFHKQYTTGHQITLMPAYRGSIDSYVFGVLDTGLIHRHEFTLGIAINRRIVVGIGGGASILHQDNEVLAGGAAHLDLRMGVGGGVFFGLPLNISVFGGSGEPIVLATLAVEIGWQSFR